MNKNREARWIRIVIEDDLARFFLESKGGNSRDWSKRFCAMLDYHKMLSKEATNKERRDQLRGYEKCMEIFLTKGVGL